MKFVMPIAGKAAQELYAQNREGQGGFYPIGRNNYYHGGVHFEGHERVVAIADGTMVAYRYNSKYLEQRVDNKAFKYSSSFVLIRHEYKTPRGQELTFHSLYMHLAPWEELKTKGRKNELFPNLVTKPGYEITTERNVSREAKAGEKGKDKIYLTGKKLPAGALVPATPADDNPQWARIDDPGDGEPAFSTDKSPEWETENVGKYFLHPGYARAVNIVYLPKFDDIEKCEIPIKAGTLIGYSGLCEAEGAPGYRGVHVEVFAGEEAEGFIKNAKDDGKPTLLKIAEGKPLHRRERRYQDTSHLTQLTRIEGTEVEITDEGDGTWVRVKDKRLAGRVAYEWLNDKYETHPAGKGHYTANSEYIDKIRTQFTGVGVSGELWSWGNLETETSATKFLWKAGKKGDAWRKLVVDVELGSAAKEYWIRKAHLADGKNGKELAADTNDCWLEDNPEAIDVFDGGAVPCDCVVPSRDTAHERDTVFHEVVIGSVVGWIKETDVTEKVSPYDWAGCGFSVVREENSNAGLLDNSDNDEKIDINNVPPFFREIFNKIDFESSSKGTLTEAELRAAMNDEKLAHSLSRVICFHRSEWYFDEHKEVLEKAKRWGTDRFLKTLLEHMCWWGGVFLNPKPVYHWHPVAFVEQMNAQNQEPPWLTIARGEIGQSEIAGDEKHNQRIVEYHATTTLKGTTDEISWCSAFVNWTLTQAGYKGTESASALSWEIWEGGKNYEEPAYGAIAVIAYKDYGSSERNGHGHVGFVTGRDGNNIVILGGNQGDTVSESSMDPNNVEVRFKSGKVWIGRVVSYVLPYDWDPIFDPAPPVRTPG